MIPDGHKGAGESNNPEAKRVINPNLRKTFGASAFIKRVLTVVVGLPLLLLVVYIGGLPLIGVCALLGLMGLREFYLAFDKSDQPIHLIGYVFTMAYFGAIHFFGAGYWPFLVIALFVVVVQGFLVIFYRELPLMDCVTTVYGVLYIPFLLSFVVLVREVEMGQYFVWLIFTACFGCDTFAYLTGSIFGRKKLVGTPSPSKSLEGIVGGVIGAGVVGFLFGLAVVQFSASGGPENILLIAVVVSLIGAAFSVIGDMAASAVKRHCNIKDFGNVFPGHGGVLDRSDSVIVVAPVVYAAMNFLIWMMP